MFPIKELSPFFPPGFGPALYSSPWARFRNQPPLFSAWCYTVRDLNQEPPPQKKGVGIFGLVLPLFKYNKLARSFIIK